MRVPGRWVFALSLALLFLPGRPAIFAQAPAPAAAPSADYSKEPYVIERYAKKTSFENDGTYKEETTVRVRVQSATAVREFGMVRLPYASATEDMELVYARVIKPNGSVVATLGENVLDMPAEITQQAPFYSDLKEKQAAVKGLEVGDTLEYQSRLNAHTPLIPGQFWFDDDFPRDSIVLDVDLTVSVPRDRYVKLKSPVLAPVTTEEKGYRIYTWRTTNLRHDSTEDKISATEVPAVQLTTFRSWDEVGRWYRQLQEGRVSATPEIRAKAQELTRGATTDAQKIQVLYSYVATQYRYIGVAFGIGRYQPHAAAEVLANGYGDCKDKHTLLAALLAASGIKAYPALLNSSRAMDPDVPAPSQFDHIITVVPRDKDFLWLDTTTEVAPAGYLTASIRSKQALMIPDAGTAQLVKTPSAPPFDTTYDFVIDGKLSEDGTLEAMVDASIRGDTEYRLRSALHNMPQPLWPNLVQAFVSTMGFPGTVEDAMVSSPESTDKPLHMTYTYTRPDYINFSNRRMSPPLPRLAMPDLPAAGTTSGPIPLQPPGRYSFDAKIELPKGFSPQLPMPIDVKQDFAEYHASYSLDSGVLHAERTLAIHASDIPQSRRDDYLALRKAVSNDEEFFISLSSLAPQWIQDGREAASRGDFSTALQFLEAAVATDQKNAQAWLTLGYIRALSGSADQGISEMWRAIDLAPKDYASYRTLIDTLSYLHRYPEALDASRKAEQVAPDNLGVTWREAQILLGMNRPGEAVTALQPAMEKNPKDARLALLLGQAYIRQGEQDKGMASFSVALESSSTPATLNVMARELADHDMRLDDALQYAQQAVSMQEDVTAKLSLDTITGGKIVEMVRLAQEWDTYGWVNFHQGNLPVAEKYVTAAWKLVQNPLFGDHLGQLYEKLGRNADASRLFALALASGQASDETGARLLRLVGSAEGVTAAVRAASGELDALRTVTLPRPVQGLSEAQAPAQGSAAPTAPAKANFLVLFTQGSAMPQVKFVDGSEELTSMATALAAAKYDIVFPDEHRANMVRQGTLTCDPNAARCQLVFNRVDIVNPID